MHYICTKSTHTKYRYKYTDLPRHFRGDILLLYLHLMRRVMRRQKFTMILKWFDNLYKTSNFRPLIMSWDIQCDRKIPRQISKNKYTECGLNTKNTSKYYIFITGSTGNNIRIDRWRVCQWERVIMSSSFHNEFAVYTEHVVRRQMGLIARVACCEAGDFKVNAITLMQVLLSLMFSWLLTMSDRCNKMHKLMRSIVIKCSDAAS